MKVRLRVYEVLLMVVLIVMLLSCASAQRNVRRGDAHMAIGEYYEAATYYRRAYKATPVRERRNRGAISYQMAEAYRRFGNTARALGGYRSAQRLGYTDTLTLLHAGQMALTVGDYRGAQQLFEEYLETHPGDETAVRCLADCKVAPGIKERGSPYTVKSERLFSSSRSDFCPAYMSADADRLFFTSTRNDATGDEESGVTGMKNGDLYFVSKDERGAWMRPEPVEGVNTEFDEGACSFSEDGNVMYLTVCRSDPQYPRMAEIWTSQRTDAKWSKPTLLRITADTLSSYAHPAVSPDGHWLYFTSDMPGGIGGLDLWRAPLEGDALGPVENLGADINTPGDEMFPAFRPSGELYFSSNGRTPTMGGLDLYRAVRDSVTDRWTVRHLPAPMNSYADDFGISFEGLHNRGFFSSGRAAAGRGRDKIYSFSYPEYLQTVQGWVYEQDGYELPDATVYMIGDDGTNLKFGVRADGSFEQPLTPGVSYIFLATAKGYLNVQNQLTIDTVEREYQHVLQFPLPSQSIPVLVRGVFYEFDKADLTPESCSALDRLVTTLEENPGITIELSAHTDIRGADAYNERLSARRAESVVLYLVEHGIQADRLTSKGYGEKQPKTISRREASENPFLREGDVLTESFILGKKPEEQEICHALNRRTEFRVLRTTYGLFPENPEK